MTTPIRRIPNLHEKATAKSLVQANISKEIFDYFFASLFCGDRGPRQALIAWFFQHLYEECQRAGIPAEWHPENEGRVLDLLERLNFREPDVAPVVFQLKPKRKKKDAPKK